mmetsp:Transcript_53111/g.147812  ORF Transcript_53111/g.147812 Transcript_53111/m.147812 type:complete len:203 (-) Transcript_53111:195-803(-)
MATRQLGISAGDCRLHVQTPLPQQSLAARRMVGTRFRGAEPSRSCDVNSRWSKRGSASASRPRRRVNPMTRCPRSATSGGLPVSRSSSRPRHRGAPRSPQRRAKSGMARGRQPRRGRRSAPKALEPACVNLSGASVSAPLRAAAAAAEIRRARLAVRRAAATARTAAAPPRQAARAATQGDKGRRPPRKSQSQACPAPPRAT